MTTRCGAVGHMEAQVRLVMLPRPCWTILRILLPIPDCLFSGRLGFRRRFKVRLYAGVGQ